MRADQPSIRCCYKGETEEFILILTHDNKLAEFRKELKHNPGTNTTVPLTEILDSFTIFTSNPQLGQVPLETPSKATLENEFGTGDQDFMIRKILEFGEVKEQKGRSREGNTNLTLGSFVPH
ncbi:ribosome maturation protein [Peziza echinospora]|nr:ribosome maturation protein [Peziza echinospora]